jgi:hypothetical protein
MSDRIDCEQTKAALADDVHHLTANSSDYLGSSAADQYAFANVIPTLQTKSELATDVSKLLANSANYLGGIYHTLYPTKFNNSIFPINLYSIPLSILFYL